MMPYIIMFSVSIIFIITGLKTKKYIFGKLLILIGLLLPCFMAGLRHISVGTDTKGYIHTLYILSFKSENLFDFFDTAYNWYLQSDYLYLVITYLFGKNKLGFGLLLFTYECLIVFPIYFSLKKLKFNKLNMTIGMLSFYLLLYNVSLNMLRQSISLSFVVLSFAYFISYTNKKEKLLSYLFALIAYGFHTTSIIIIPMFLIYKFYTSKIIKEKTKSLISFFIIMFSILFIVFYRNILTFVGTTGIYQLALYYLNNYSIKNFNYYQTAINLLIIFMIIVNKKSILEENYSYKLLLLLSLINLLISSGLGYYILYSQRIMLYVEFILVFCYISRFKYDSKNGQLSLVIYILLLVASWYLYFVYKNVNETVPYIMNMINI